jgi:hypothetical protein
MTTTEEILKEFDDKTETYIATLVWTFDITQEEKEVIKNNIRAFAQTIKVIFLTQAISLLEQQVRTETLEPIKADLDFILFGLKLAIKHEREGSAINGHEADVDGCLIDLDNLLTNIKGL